MMSSRVSPSPRSMTQVNCTLRWSRRTFAASASPFISIKQANGEFVLLLRVVFEETFRFSLSGCVVWLGRAGPGVGFSNESRLACFLSFERVAAPVVTGERLGVGHQLPALFSQFVHDASKRDVRPGPRPEDDLPLIQPQFPSPGLPRNLHPCPVEPGSA